MEIRRINKEDIKSVADIAKQSAPYPWPETVFHDCLRANYHGWVLILKEEIIGFIIILLQQPECHLMNIAIKPDYQHQGYGKQLLQHAIQYIKKSTAKNMLLEVRRSNQAAVNFYKQCGGAEIGIRHNYYPFKTGREDALLLLLSFG